MDKPAPRLDRIPRDVVALTDYEPLARERLDDNAWAYLAGGAGDGVTARANRAAFDALHLVPRVLAGPGGNTAIELLGLTLRHPVLLAPVAYQRLFHPDGERATAMAAAALDTVMVASTQASTSLEDIASAGDGAPQWFQLYLQPDRGITRTLVARAEAAGYRAIVVTVDAPLSGLRNAEQRAGFRLPPDIRAVNLDGLPAAAPAEPHGDNPVFAAAARNAAGWDDIGWLVQTTSLPVVVKGLLSPNDARRAIDAGAAAIVVSNHGGRTLDSAVPAILALPRIADAVAGRIPLLLDGGVRRGTDVLKAIALGARAVLIGQPYAMALAAAGPLGVAHVLKVLSEELAMAMVLAGVQRLDQVSPDLIFVP